MLAFLTAPFARSAFCGSYVAPSSSQALTSRPRPCHILPRQACAPRAQLIGVPGSLSSNLEPSPQEVLLAELRFSDPTHLPTLVEASLPQLDESFYKYLEETIDKSSDMEERETLRSLRDAITSLMGQMLEEIQKQKGEYIPSESPDGTAETEDADAKPQLTEEDAQSSYDELIDTLLRSFKSIPADLDDKERAQSMRKYTDIYYDRIDMRFLQRLNERIVSTDKEVPLLEKLRDAITQAMNERVTTAMTSLKTVLSNPPPKMREEIDKLNKEGKIDDAFVLLLQANVEEAKKAGATDAVKILSDLLKYASDLNDISVEPEVRLIRTLLRTDDEEIRLNLLTESFEGGGSVLLPDDTRTMGTKIDGKKFVAALRKLIQEYGNVDEKFILRLSKIGEESEAVARKIYDMEGKDVKELQEEAFHKRSVSIWDLEEFEHQEIGEGREAPWEGRLGSIPEKMGFGTDGKLSV